MESLRNDPVQHRLPCFVGDHDRYFNDMCVDFYDVVLIARRGLGHGRKTTATEDQRNCKDSGCHGIKFPMLEILEMSAFIRILCRIDRKKKLIAMPPAVLY